MGQGSSETACAFARTAAILALMMATACVDKTRLPRPLAGADPQKGRQIAQRVDCAACHEIPGVRWPKGRVGASLAGFGASPLIAGRFPNQPEILVRWLRNAPDLDPTTAMPPVPLTETEARDVAAYLYTLQ